MTTNQRDYYEVLGLKKDADAKAIKDAFRKLALQFHPDRNKTPEAEARFKEIAEAYAVLSDPKKRAEYDARGFAGVEGFSAEDLFGGINFGDIFGDFGFDFGGGLFDRLFRHQRRGPQRGADIEVRLVVPLERVDRGGEETIRFHRPVTCAKCDGTGAQSGTAPKTCAACGGSGTKIISRQEKQGVHFQQMTTCPVCRGAGTVIEKPCATCHGSGQTEKDESLKVRIPAGIDEGMALRVAGHGFPSNSGGPPGDLYVLVHSAPDARFERIGSDLWRIEEIDVADAVLGTQRTVPTLHGNVEVTIPPGTQPDEVLRLRGKGLPQFGDGRGDLNLRIRVRIPAELGPKERSLYEQLRALRSRRWPA
jgi:molecular chaperone DnaJ